jgi:chemotaxis protein methyltransferase CheR
LRWALPKLGLRWEGFRGLHGQVCKRIVRRARSLGLLSIAEYRARLEQEPAEWRALDQLCRVTISRFCRDRGVFERLAEDVLPTLAERALHEGRNAINAWSAGCASGEEPWSLHLAWRMALAPRYPQLSFFVRATDSDEELLLRARAARYGPGSLRELPDVWRERAFVPVEGGWRLVDEFREGVTFVHEDLRSAAPDGVFDLVLCRNLAFTYFAEDLQRLVLERFRACLRPGGFLVIGRHERLPSPHPFVPEGPSGNPFFAASVTNAAGAPLVRT